MIELVLVEFNQAKNYKDYPDGKSPYVYEICRDKGRCKFEHIHMTIKNGKALRDQFYIRKEKVKEYGDAVKVLDDNSVSFNLMKTEVVLEDKIKDIHKLDNEIAQLKHMNKQQAIRIKQLEEHQAADRVFKEGDHVSYEDQNYIVKAGVVLQKPGKGNHKLHAVLLEDQDKITLTTSPTQNDEDVSLELENPEDMSGQENPIEKTS
jgi:hypothetical protein